MNQDPVNQQPDQIQTPPSQPTTPPVVTQPITTDGSKKMAIWALVLSIVGLLTGIVFFVSAPLALTALILAIVTLAKHKQGKGMGIAAIIISSIALIMIPFWLVVGIASYSVISEEAQPSSVQTVDSY